MVSLLATHIFRTDAFFANISFSLFPGFRLQNVASPANTPHFARTSGITPHSQSEVVTHCIWSIFTVVCYSFTPNGPLFWCGLVCFALNTLFAASGRLDTALQRLGYLLASSLAWQHELAGSEGSLSLQPVTEIATLTNLALKTAE
jgi:hypothetical protein